MTLFAFSWGWVLAMPLVYNRYNRLLLPHSIWGHIHRDIITWQQSSTIQHIVNILWTYCEHIVNILSSHSAYERDRARKRYNKLYSHYSHISLDFYAGFHTHKIIGLAYMWEFKVSYIVMIRGFQSGAN